MFVTKKPFKLTPMRNNRDFATGFLVPAKFLCSSSLRRNHFIGKPLRSHRFFIVSVPVGQSLFAETKTTLDFWGTSKIKKPEQKAIAHAETIGDMEVYS
jgi:hypothetical protein